MKIVYTWAVVVLLVRFGLLADTRAMGETYTTAFPLDENPISESGNWINGKTTGLLWADCQTTNGFVWGDDNQGTYADPTAILTGTWGSNQTATATVRVINQPTGSGCCSEIELRLRSLITANTNRGYEILFSTYTGNDYVQIVTWHGPQGEQGVGWDYVATTSGWGAPTNGSIVSASISNSTIQVYMDGILVLTGVDTEWSDGNPGVGFYGDTTPNVGFSSFTATDSIDAPVIVSQPQGQTVNASSNAAFSVVATSDTPISYQWYFEATNAIAGATNSQLVLTNVEDADGGAYLVWVSNLVGAVTSDSAQLMVNDLPMPANPNLERDWNAGFKVRESLLLGTDPDGDGLTLTSVGPLSEMAATVTNSQGWVFYAPPPELTSGDTFNYTVSDGRGGLVAGIASVVAVTNNSASSNITWVAEGDGSVQVSGSGIPGRTYTVEFSANPGSQDWQPLGAVVCDDFGAVEYVDPAPAGGGTRIYRAVSQ